METFQAISASPGVAIAAAARLHAEFGTVSFAPERLRRLGERLRQFGVEEPDPDEVILVADTVPPGFLIAPFPGLRVVGVAAQSQAAISPRPLCPTVIGLGSALLDQVEEDMIIIVDGDRGRIYLEPDAATLARYQTPQRSARRFFLEETHLPAKTASDNRIIPVMASVATVTHVTAAMEAGADGIVIDADNDFLGGETVIQTAGEQIAVMTEVAHQIAGQPLFLNIPTERLALSALSRAAATCPLHVILSDLTIRLELEERLQELEAMQEEDDLLFGTVYFQAGLSGSSTELDIPESLETFVGAFLTTSLEESQIDRLLLIAGLTQRAEKPLTVTLNHQSWAQTLPRALDLGVSRLVVPIPLVGDVKDAIRMS